MVLRLYYGPLLVGSLINVIEHQGTWFGRFELSTLQDASTTRLRIGQFIWFSQEWNAQVGSGQNPDAAEFDSFQDVLSSGLWHTIATDGFVLAIDKAPLFSDEDVSWKYSTT